MKNPKEVAASNKRRITVYWTKAKSVNRDIVLNRFYLNRSHPAENFFEQCDAEVNAFAKAVVCASHLGLKPEWIHFEPKDKRKVR